MNHRISSDAMMRHFGETLGQLLRGGEVIELVGDVGAGKTTLVKGLAKGLGIDETVQSPTFTINRVYETSTDVRLVHYDFYRLTEPGIMSMEIAESIDDPGTIVVIEWGDIVEGVLPDDRLTVKIESESENDRLVTVTAHGRISERVVESLS